MWKCPNGSRTVAGMGSELSMAARAEITRKYVRASKKDEGTELSYVCAVTGWSRDNACRRPGSCPQAPPGPMARPRPRARKYSS